MIGRRMNGLMYTPIQPTVHFGRRQLIQVKQQRAMKQLKIQHLFVMAGGTMMCEFNNP